MFINWLRKKICNPDMPEPTGLSFIESFEISSLLYAAFPDAQLYISDHKFKTTTKEELMRFLKYDMTDAYNYTSEYYDCDDFSYALMGTLSNPKWGCLPFGIMWTGTKFDSEGKATAAHAVNFFIDASRKIWVIEPQNDKVFVIPKTWKPFLLMM